MVICEQSLNFVLQVPRPPAPCSPRHWNNHRRLLQRGRPQHLQDQLLQPSARAILDWCKSHYRVWTAGGCPKHEVMELQWKLKKSLKNVAKEQFRPEMFHKQFPIKSFLQKLTFFSFFFHRQPTELSQERDPEWTSSTLTCINRVTYYTNALLFTVIFSCQQFPSEIETFAGDRTSS